MTIQQGNIQFVESQVMDDVPEGGGAATGNIIVDGAMNNVFEDISDLDRAYGRFNLRKLFVAVRTLSTDLFGGAKSVVTALPEDAAIAYTLFTTNDPFDRRADAANRVEAYLFKGPTWGGYLHENHITGMRQIEILQLKDTPLPPIGKTLCLVENEDTASEKEQYVRVIDVEVETRTFIDSQGQYERWAVRCSLSDALRHNFTGHEARRSTSVNYSNGARLRDTSVADATRYYSGKPLAQAASIGDLRIRAESMFTSLVPSAQSETPISNQALNPEITRTINAGSRDVEVAQQAHTLWRDVTAENRRLNWAETLRPIPAPGTFTLSFLSQGNWYTITDGGDGTLSGSDPGVGAGTLDYQTGAMSVTLGALPDAGGKITNAWASPVHYERRDDASEAGNAVEQDFRLRGTVPNTPVVTATVKWTKDGTEQTQSLQIHDDFDPDTGEYDARIPSLPDSGTTALIEYQWQKEEPEPEDEQEPDAEPSTQRRRTHTVQMVNNALTIPAPESDLFDLADDKKLSIRVPVTGEDGRNGVSVRVLPGGTDVISHDYITGEVVGTFDWSSRTLTITKPLRYTHSSWSPAAVSWADGTHTYQIRNGVDFAISVWEKRNTTEPGSGEEEPDLGLVLTRSHEHDLAESGAAINLMHRLSYNPVPNSIEFRLGQNSYIDRDGVLYTNIDPATGSGLAAGQMDYDTGVATVNYWQGAPNTISVDSLLTIFGQWTAVGGVFRSLQSPLAPESLQVTATATNGTQLSATADRDGIISSEWIEGDVNYQFGTASVQFGKWRDDSLLTEDEKAEDWYDPENVIEGQIWQPLEVIPSTMRYNAVAYTYVPLDADILGIDPVRLPADGRVPIYRPGDVALVMHPQDEAPIDVSTNDVISTRPRIGWVRLTDSTGEPITEGYALDRATGEITITDDSNITNPVTIRHTVADLRFVTDVEITGHLTFSRPLSHNYPASETIVASCLLHGDRRARVQAVWDEQTWSGEWLDTIDGSAATASLNVIDFPIEVSNEGCDTDRWLLRNTNASANQWELISEQRGLVWSGTYEPGGADIAPINPRTREYDPATGTYTGGVPYLKIPGMANGGGWSTGNVVRINTLGAIADFWIARAIQQSDIPLDDGADGAEIYCLGNIDRK